MCFFFFNDTATTEIYTLSLHDALPISEVFPARAASSSPRPPRDRCRPGDRTARPKDRRSEEHTSELQSPCNLVCRLLLEKKKQLYIRRSNFVALTMYSRLPNSISARPR